jgi:hypothetical protein
MARDFRVRTFSSRTCKAYAVAIPRTLELPTYRLKNRFFRSQATNGRFAPIAVIHLSRGAPVAPVDELGQR